MKRDMGLIRMILEQVEQSETTMVMSSISVSPDTARPPSATI